MFKTAKLLIFLCGCFEINTQTLAITDRRMDRGKKVVHRNSYNVCSCKIISIFLCCCFEIETKTLDITGRRIEGQRGSQKQVPCIHFKIIVKAYTFGPYSMYTGTWGKEGEGDYIIFIYLTLRYSAVLYLYTFLY